jgi:flagellar hook-associated protein 1 FlgK
MATINDVLTALNAIPNISASLNATGQLQISSTVANSGIAINTMSSDVGPLNQGFSHYFGLNDLFSGDGAETIDVAEFLRRSNNYLATGTFSSSATLAAGDRGVSRGDGSVADALSDLLVNNVSFDAAGNFASQSNTLKGYMESIMANAANRAQIADDEAETSRLIYQQTKDILNNKSGVNIDEETARMVDLQTKYQASASVVLTIRTMFQALMDAIR